ncbi:peptide ABC transporter substrate-binding protein [Allostella vacuolata]|nr:peptide ABC transporter substrate-binding protein [Stella vacuolata]
MSVAATAGAATAPRRRSVVRRLLRDPAALLASVFLVAVVLSAILAPWIAPYDPYFTDPSKGMRPPFEDPAYPLGTDAQGRDMLSRLLYGTRLTLLMGLVALVTGGAIGTLVGIVAAYFRRVDGLLMRLMDVLLSFPAILFGLAIAAVTGPGLTPIIIALAIATIPLLARIARSSALVVMQQDYIDAARSIGLVDAAIIWRYLLPNCLSSIFVFSTLRFGQIVLIGAALSFLGLGAQPPTAELGTMAANGRDFLFFAPHIATIPSLTIFAIVLAFNVLGDAMRDVLDPRLRL